jgi:YfiH family protein
VFLYRTSLGPVDLAFTDRYGGVSGVPYDELNLAVADADVPADRERNVALVLDEFGPGDVLVDLAQVHGAGVHRAGPDAAGRPEADGVVADGPGRTLMVRAADCVPVLLADAEAGVVGAAHCGRPGLLAGVVGATVEELRALGAGSLTAWIGPHICGGCYEVPADLQEQVAAVVPASRATTSWGTPSLDIGAGVRSQLGQAGVSVVDVSRCTRESADLYSYRRDGADAGRQAGLIRVRS